MTVRSEMIDMLLEGCKGGSTPERFQEYTDTAAEEEIAVLDRMFAMLALRLSGRSAGNGVLDIRMRQCAAIYHV